MKVKFALLLLLLFISVNLSGTVYAKVIMVFGDSLSSGYGFDHQYGWVKLLEQRLSESSGEHSIINASISGNTSGNGLGRIKSDLSLHNPDIVILELGGNDGLRGHPPAMFKSNMKKIIEIVLKKQTEVLLLGIKLPPSYGRRYSKAFESIYQQLAEDYELPLVPFFMEGVGTNQTLMQKDGIHPNRKGQPLLLDNVWPRLEAMLN